MVSDRWSNKQEICDVYNTPVEIKEGSYGVFTCESRGAKLLDRPITSVLEWAKFLNYCKGWVAETDKDKFFVQENTSKYDSIHRITFHWYWETVVFDWHEQEYTYMCPILLPINVKRKEPYLNLLFYRYNFFKSMEENIQNRINEWGYARTIDCWNSSSMFNNLLNRQKETKERNKQ